MDEKIYVKAPSSFVGGQKEVVAALPKLIKLNPIVVKEVFHRLLLSHQGDNSVGQSPLSPAELLLALHNIDHTKCDMKSIIKGKLQYAGRPMEQTKLQ